MAGGVPSAIFVCWAVMLDLAFSLISKSQQVKFQVLPRRLCIFESRFGPVLGSGC